MLAYTECMRDHGIDMPDPQMSDGDGRRERQRVIALEGDPGEPTSSRRPRTACEPLMDDAVGDIEIDPEREAEMREQLLEYAAVHARPRHRHAGPDVRRRRPGEDAGRPPAASRDSTTTSRPPARRATRATAADVRPAPDGGGDAGVAHRPDADGRLTCAAGILGGAAVLAGAAGSHRRRRVRRVGRRRRRDADDTGRRADAGRRRPARPRAQRGARRHGRPRRGPTARARRSGTLTALPAPGDTIAPGDTVVEVDGAPSSPWPARRRCGGRSGRASTTATTSSSWSTRWPRSATPRTYDVTVDDEWTSATTRAVKAFQEDHGQDDDGTVDVGEIVWIDGPVRVDSVGGTLGQQAAEAGHRGHRARASPCTSTSPSPTPTSLPLGGTVDVELPSGEVVDRHRHVDRRRRDRRRPATHAAGRDHAGRRRRRCADGTPVDVTAKIVSRRGRRSPCPVEARARPRRGRLRRRGRDWPTATTRSSASSSACSPTATSRSPATSPPATRWSCRERSAARPRAGRRDQALRRRAARARPRRRRPDGRAAASSSSSSGRPARASRR